MSAACETHKCKHTASLMGNAAVRVHLRRKVSLSVEGTETLPVAVCFTPPPPIPSTRLTLEIFTKLRLMKIGEISKYDRLS